MTRLGWRAWAGALALVACLGFVLLGCGETAPTAKTSNGITILDNLPEECQVGSIEVHFENNGKAIQVWGLNTNPRAVAQAYNIAGKPMEKACSLNVPYEWPDETTGTARCTVLSDGSSSALPICTSAGSVEIASCMHRSLNDQVCSLAAKGKVVG